MWQLALRCPHCQTSSGERVSEAEWRCVACEEGEIRIAPDGIWEFGV